MSDRQSLRQITFQTLTLGANQKAKIRIRSVLVHTDDAAAVAVQDYPYFNSLYDNRARAFTL